MQLIPWSAIKRIQSWACDTCVTVTGHLANISQLVVSTIGREQVGG